MKYENHTGTSRPAPASRIMIALVAFCFALGFAVQAQADCTVLNWTGQTGLDENDVGFQSSPNNAANNRRYAGPCGLRVPVDGTARFLTDESPLAESTYIVRFYVYLDSAGTEPMLLFTADDGTDDIIEVWYNANAAFAASPGDLTLNVVDNGSGNNTLHFEDIGAGWHSVELVWEASDAANNIRFALNTSEDDGADSTLSVNTSGLQVVNAHLGNTLGVNTGGWVDYDDFDSRRISRPGRLCRGLTDPDRAPAGDGWQRLTAADRQSIFIEIATGGSVPANGQPDFNEDGLVNSNDRFAIFVAIATGQNSCENLR